ncbi:MAG: valine--tRNA ligase, partial [Candidatus Bathyarchaeia archaeon]
QICPFITEAIWLELYSNRSINVQCFPDERDEWKDSILALLPKFMDFNNAIWQYKKKNNIALNQEINGIVYAPADLKPFEEDLKAMHKIGALIFGKPETEAAEKISEEVFIVKA